MEINEIYDTINNPIENPEVLVRLIDEYSKSNESNFRDRVITSKNKEYSSQEYTVDEIDLINIDVIIQITLKLE